MLLKCRAQNEKVMILPTQGVQTAKGLTWYDCTVYFYNILRFCPLTTVVYASCVEAVTLTQRAGDVLRNVGGCIHATLCSTYFSIGIKSSR